VVLLDVNILVYAFRPDAKSHEAYADYVQQLVRSRSAFGLADLVCSGFVRIVTHPKIFAPPAYPEEALPFVNELRAQPNCVIITPGARHWGIFAELCLTTNAKGNLVADAYLAALAIESGSEWITTDRDFARFPGLRWRHPLEP
jgi:uncharacterized protein